MAYTVKLTRQARKDLTNLPPQIQQWAIATIDALAAEPRPASCKQLKGGAGYSIRHGSYRIIYEVQDGQLLVVVIRVAHRKDVYRQL